MLLNASPLKKEIKKIPVSILIPLLYIKFVMAVILDYEGSLIAYIDIATYLICLLSINLRKVDSSLFIVLGFLLIAVITPSARTCAFLIMTLYVLKDINIKFVAMLNVLCSLCVFIYIAIMLQNNVIEDKEMVVMTTELERRDFGFGNPNMLAVFTLGTLANIYILIADHFRFLTLLVLSVTSWVVAVYSGSRTFGATMIVIIILYIFIKKFRKRNSTIYFWIKVLPLVLTVATLLCAFAVHLLPILDILFSFRLSFYSQLLFQTGPIGYIIGNSLIDEITIDSSYMHLIFRAGIGGFTFFYLIYRRCIEKISEKDCYMMPLIIGMMLYGTTESYLLFTLVYNNMIIWLFIFQSYIRNKSYTK